MLNNRTFINDDNKHKSNNNLIKMVTWIQDIGKLTNFNLSDERPELVVVYL